ncbi:MAG: hypothetical protein R3E86_10040 [Pseudomonadales bacterium]
MAAVVLTLILAFVAGGGLWLLLGPRLALAEEPERNDVLNLLAYVGALLPPAFVVVLFLVERL